MFDSFRGSFWGIKQRASLPRLFLGGLVAVVMILGLWMALTPFVSPLNSTAIAATNDIITGLTASSDHPTLIHNATHFTASVTGGTGITYQWDFGDGSSGSGSNPTYTYSKSGSYTAIVTATNATDVVTASTKVFVGNAIVEVGPGGSNTFVPKEVTVEKGDWVVWVRRSGTHSVTEDDDRFEQPLGSAWFAYIRSFNTADEYPYHCELHGGDGGVGMSGTVFVEEAQPAEPISGLAAHNDSPTIVDQSTHFSATVTGGSDIAYAWVFGDGHSGNGKTPSHTYTEVGVYTATVTAANVSNTVTATTFVQIMPVPVTGLSADNDSPTVVNNPTAFSASVTGGTDITYEWDFGDGTSGNGIAPTHTYTQTGSYTATVTASNATNSLSADTVVQILAELPPPVTGLSVTNDGPTLVNNPTNFEAVVTGGTGITYEWDYGDGNSDNDGGATPAYTYTQSGIYTVTVVAANATNAQTATTTVYVADAIVNVTDFTFTPKNVTIESGDMVVWVRQNGTHSVTADDGSFEQLLGSNWSSFAQTFIATSSTDDLTIAYHCTQHGGPGGVGMSGTVTVDTPSQPPTPITGLTATNDGPTQVNTPTGFSADVTGGTEISYTWTFGDGENGTGNTPSHTYTESGVYTATVVASNDANAQTATTTVYVGDAVVDVGLNGFSSFTPAEISVPVGSTVIWILRSGTHSVTADDGTFNQPAGNDWSPFIHTFTTPKTYDYYCTVHGGPGGVGMSGKVIVEDEDAPDPITGLTADNDGPTKVNNPTGFTTSVASGTEISYTWTFGDGGTGTGSAPTHTYAQSGEYIATVVATNASSVQTATTTVQVGDEIVDVGLNGFSSFTPAEISVPVGSTVIWILRSGTHSVTADDGSFEQPAGSNWSPFVNTFNQPGAFDYHCTIHGGPGRQDMSGRVTVTGEAEQLKIRLPDIRREEQ